MKVRKIDIIVLCVCVGLVLTFFLIFWINLNKYVEDSKLKITDDISTSDSTLLQKEFGISLPAQAQITAFGYSTDLVVIRIEGVEDLPAFLTDTIHLELDVEKLDGLLYIINYSVNNTNQPCEDMYGTKRESWFFRNSDYQTSPRDSSTTTYFFLVDDKLVIEISKTAITSENHEAIKEIVGT